MKHDGRSCLPCPYCKRKIRALAAPFGIRAGKMTYLADCPDGRCQAQSEYYASIKSANNGNLPYIYSAGEARKKWNAWAATKGIAT